MSDIIAGNAPCSWGALEFDALEGESAGYRLVLDEMAQTGYKGTELGDWGFMPTDPAVLRDELAVRDLAMLGAFVPVALKDAAAHADGVAVAVKTAKLLAAVGGAACPPYLVLADNNGSDPVRTKNAGRIAAEMGLSTDEWRVFAHGADEVARAVKGETGLRTVFHHHGGGYVETRGEVARLLDLTDPELVGLVLDTGHYAFGTGLNASDANAAVLAAFDTLGERIWHVHFKDCEPGVATLTRRDQMDYFEAVGAGVFCELGKGCVDFPAVVARLNARGYAGAIVVEQDVLPGMGTPRESAQRNRDYLKSIGI